MRSQQPATRKIGRKASTPVQSTRRGPGKVVVGTLLAAVGAAASSPAGRRALTKAKDRATTAARRRNPDTPAPATDPSGEI
jgi:hypothetical protein